ncbi:DUF6993 domain-containing protein [Leifsonia sp. Leaf264]|uniref:DUF6993 domain-containing protein n=1 Tax=Leifsonia sp. Leaf264 TaxID=1736314 RepID=UPI0006FADBA4|nr:hypothetical protein [Leifsonia sp. Leaf264]KQO98907.1 hypothetical protein ASF30_12665 [Leifsonia sp. Leaf264]
MSRATKRLILSAVVTVLFIATAVLSYTVLMPEPPEPPAPKPTPTAAAVNPGHIAVPEPYDPEASVAQAERFFDRVAGTVAGTGAMDGAAYIQAFRAAGVPDDVMEVTDHNGTAGTMQETVQFSVRYGNTCLIGDVGHGTFTSTTMPETHWDTCLIGGTRPIDF